MLRPHSRQHGHQSNSLARNPTPLDEFASELRAAHNVKVSTLALDLTHPDLLEHVRGATDEVDVGLLIYNAGNSAGRGAFVERSLEHAIWPINLCAVSLVTLAHHFGAKMVPRGRGGLLFTGSLTGYEAYPNVASYCGAKAFIHTFTEALWAEVKNTGVQVLCYSVGLTDTPNMRRSNVVVPPGTFLSDPEIVAQSALADLAGGKGPIRVPPQKAGRMQRVFASMQQRFREMEMDVSAADGRS
jgi:short-subunit dehydrogenase